MTLNSALCHGGDGNDTFTGGNGKDVLFGVAGGTSLKGGTGIDVFYGMNSFNSWNIYVGGGGADIVYGNSLFRDRGTGINIGSWVQ